MAEIVDFLEISHIDRATETVTLEWYKELHKWHEIIRSVELYGKSLTI